MKILKIGAVTLVIALVVAAIAAPLGPLPGFLIRGSASAVPDQWGDTRPIHEIKLQIGDGPIGRTVIIWMVQVDGNLHVVGQNDSGWARGIGAGGPVRMQMQGNLYELTATPVTTDQARLFAAWRDKYVADYPEIIDGFPPAEEAARNATVFRLTPRV
jgi:hypothetical protein